MDFFLSLSSLLLLFTLAVNLGLPIFIYLKDRRNIVNISFSALLFSIALWTFSLFLFLHAQTPEQALFFRRLTPIGSGFLIGFFLYFSLVFPRAEKKYSLLMKTLIFLPPILFAFASIFTNLMVKGFFFQRDLPLYFGKPNFGGMYKFYFAYIVCFFAMAVFNLVRRHSKSEGREKLQVWYVLFGTAITGIAAIFASLVLPLLGLTLLFTLGPVFTLIMAGLISYAIVKHRLLDIGNFSSQGLLLLNFIIALIALVFFVISKSDFTTIVSFLAFLANLTLALYAYFYNPKSLLNKIFCILVLSVAFWILGILMFRNQMEVTTSAYFWAKVFYVSGTFIPILLVYFAYYFPTEKPKLPTALKIALPLIAAFVLWVICFMDWLIIKVVMRPWGPEVVLGWFYNLFTFSYILLMGYSFLHLFRKLMRAAGVSAIQLKYVLLGMFISSVIGVAFNLVLPLLGNYQLIWVGPIFSIVFVAFTAYAILQHRLMSIEVVIQRSAVYGMVTVMIMALYALAVIISETFFRQIIGYTSFIITALAALVIAIAYQPLIKSFQSFTDRLFFRGRYDYQKTLLKISHEIASVIKLEELTRLISISFIKIMKISEISFLLPEREGEHFRSLPLDIPRYKKIEIDVKSPIAAWLSAARDILVLDEVENEISHQEALGREGEVQKRNLEEVRDAMERLGISVWVPIISKGELIGIIALGNKLSGDVFTSEDIALLTTLANQTAVALDNARLYNEVLSMKDYSEEILQSMTNGVLTTDNQGRIVTYNFMAERITGRKLNEVMGKSCEEIWGRRGAITTAVERTLKDRPSLNFETSIASPERGLVPVSLSSTLLKDSQGKKMGALLSIQDLSEMKELEDKIRRADKLTALATMAAGMAHEIKNPLSSMKVFAQLLPKKIDDAEYRKKLNEILPREIDRIDRIVESLLGFARSTTPTFEKIRIEEVLEENLKYFEDKARNAGVKIKKSYADLPEVEVDRVQISQVFSNLILNGIQAMPEGGELTVSTFPGKKVDDVLQTVKLQISDTGHGIPEEMQKKLFDPFFTTRYGGTGLGLTIAHSIVDGHKGFIDVESRVGKGTTFTVTLPVSQGLV